LARNFGQHRAITAGLDKAQGDWVVVMDCDLQDPPEEIPYLYAKACEGYEIVVAKFEERAESAFRRKVSRYFWVGLSWLAGIPFDYRVGNFRIMSQRVVENFRSYREQLRLLGGITSLMGFTTATLTIKRHERFSGETSYTFRKLLSVAIDIAMAYSDKPLKISIYLGAAIASASLFIGVSFLLLGLSGRIEVPGWTTMVVSLYFIGGLIIGNLGVIGYYLGKTFDETKQRPLYVIENTTDEWSPEGDKISKRSFARVIWITGLSGAGKSTLSRELFARLRAAGEPTVMLDGDELREVFGAVAATADNHGREGRLALAMQYAHLCRLLAGQGLVVVIATISLFREVHAWNRVHLPGYFEVYLKVPLEELRRRDPKGIYRSFDAGEVAHVAGLDLPIDEPEAADWVVEFERGRSVTTLVEDIFNQVNRSSCL
jgi:adenylylsulfate kinase-like enzyme